MSLRLAAELLGIQKTTLMRKLVDSSTCAPPNKIVKKNDEILDEIADVICVQQEFNEVVEEEDVFYFSKDKYLFEDHEENEFLSYESSDSEYSEDEETSDIKSDLSEWVSTTLISNRDVNRLLVILRKHGLDLPLSKETLLKRKKIPLLAREMCPGQYLHIGIQ